MGFEALALDVGVVELGVTWGDFLAVDDELVNFDGLAAGADFRQRHQLAGNAGDEAGIEGFFLNELLKGLLDDFVVLHACGNLDALFFAAGAAASGVDLEEVFARGQLDEVVVTGALPRAGEVDGADDVALLVLVLDLEAAAEFLGEVAGQLFDEIGHFLEIRERPIRFEHRELGVVAARDAFVAEAAVEFENLGEAADEQALEE